MMNRSRLFTAMLAAVAIAGCAGTPQPHAADPFEAVNRGVNSFNHGADSITLRPIARAYEAHVPAVVRTGASNFFGNLGDVASAANNLLQMKVPEAAQDATRFAFNTMFGLGGLLDIASEAGLERKKADFGSTLAHYGVPGGPYVELPVFGPSTLRDAVALPVDLVTHPLHHVAPAAGRNALAAADAVDTRARALPLDPVLESAIDRYSLTRDMYLQHRSAQLGLKETGQEGEILYTCVQCPTPPADRPDAASSTQP